MKNKILLCSLIFLNGCTTSGVTQTGPDSYMGRAHSTLFTIDPGGAGAIANAIKLASAHCAELGKHHVIKNTQTSKVGSGAQAIINYECLSEDDPDYTKPELEPAEGPAIIINNQVN